MSRRRRAALILHDLLFTPDVDAPARLLCRLCTAAVPVSGTAVVLQGTGRANHILVAADGIAAAAQDLQSLYAEGPTVDARGRDQPVMCADLAELTDRWPMFAPAAAAAGIRAAFAVPLLLDGTPLGLLALYRGTPGELTTAQLDRALTFADAATLAVLYLQSTMDDEDDLLHPELTVDSDIDIHVAVGMIAAQATVPVDDALQLLRARAFSTDTPMCVVARDVTARRVEFAVRH